MNDPPRSSQMQFDDGVGISLQYRSKTNGEDSGDREDPKTEATKASAPAAAKKAGSALTKPMTPSKELTAVVGKGPMPRTEITSKIWGYIKEHKLQNAANKRNILADAKLKAIFGNYEVTMFEMTKLVSAHLS